MRLQWFVCGEHVPPLLYSGPLREWRAMHFTELIRIKRDGGELSDDQLRFAIESYTADATPDYHMAALVMAFFFSGMNPR